jgi:glucose-6-phosphate isomerase
MIHDIEVAYERSEKYINISDIRDIEHAALAAHKMLHDRSGAGSEFLGWLGLPLIYDKEEIDRVKSCAEKIRKDSDILIVVGIGGSYLGARSAIELLGSSFSGMLSKEVRKAPLIIFAGNNISSTYHSDLMDLVKDKDISVNVISKSGTTTEPALAFRLLKDFMEEKYGKKEAAERIYATTDSKRGALKKLADANGYETFAIPDDIGGRYSVLTPVGLLPIAVSGADIDAILEGAADGCKEYADFDISGNECCRYAALRNILYSKGKTTEVLVNYEPSLHYMTEWWKQLFGESEGKQGKGIFPAGADFTTDLHSMGQYIQDGLRNIFETVLYVKVPKKSFKVKSDRNNIDGLNYLEGMDLDYINKKAFEGTLLAHLDGGVPQLVITLPVINEFYYGKLVYFFEKACGLSGYILGVNPFDQPGVEAYKKNMFALLGKPGYEKEREVLVKRL